MDSVERVKQICKERSIAISKLEKDLGFSNGYIRALRKGVFPQDRLMAIANYLKVSPDYIMTGKKEWQPKLTKKDERDIKNAIEAIKNQLSTGTGLMYDGEPLDEESQEAILAAIEVAERTAILEAKKRYTPKKYRE